jgi:hypothetical protein
MVALKAGWVRGILMPCGPRNESYEVGGVVLKDGMPFRLRGVVGRVRQRGGLWVMNAPSHAMDGDCLDDHVGEKAEVPIL